MVSTPVFLSRANGEASRHAVTKWAGSRSIRQTASAFASIFVLAPPIMRV